MIPHHQNAVNMAKTLLHSDKISCYDLTLETNDCLLHVLLVSIINSQNHQIQVMRGVLESKGLKEDYDCDVSVSGDFTSEDEKRANAESEDYKLQTDNKPVESEDTREVSEDEKDSKPMSSEDMTAEENLDSSGSKTTASFLMSIVLCSRTSCVTLTSRDRRRTRRRLS